MRIRRKRARASTRAARRQCVRPAAQPDRHAFGRRGDRGGSRGAAFARGAAGRARRRGVCGVAGRSRRCVLPHHLRRRSGEPDHRVEGAGPDAAPDDLRVEHRGRTGRRAASGSTRPRRRSRSHFSGQRLLEAEAVLRDSGLPGVALRLGGIYGPRPHAPDRRSPPGPRRGRARRSALHQPHPPRRLCRCARSPDRSQGSQPVATSASTASPKTRRSCCVGSRACSARHRRGSRARISAAARRAAATSGAGTSGCSRRVIRSTMRTTATDTPPCSRSDVSAEAASLRPGDRGDARRGVLADRGTAARDVRRRVPAPRRRHLDGAVRGRADAGPRESEHPGLHRYCDDARHAGAGRRAWSRRCARATALALRARDVLVTAGATGGARAPRSARSPSPATRC